MPKRSFNLEFVSNINPNYLEKKKQGQKYWTDITWAEIFQTSRIDGDAEKLIDEVADLSTMNLAPSPAIKQLMYGREILFDHLQRAMGGNVKLKGKVQTRTAMDKTIYNLTIITTARPITVEKAGKKTAYELPEIESFELKD